jgi:hypothetical protein
MADFNIRSESVDVEQIMKQIRGRIKEKRGADYTEEQVRELATVRLEKFLDPKNLRSDLLEQFRKSRPAPPVIPSEPPPIDPPYVFDDQTLFASHRGFLRFMRKLLKPILKLFFNPNTLNQVLHSQAQFNVDMMKRDQRRKIEMQIFDRSRAEWNVLYYEVLHNLVLETTRNGIELKNLKMRVESLTSRLDFSERRVRALEGVVQYRPEAVRPPRDRDRDRDKDRDRDRDRGDREQSRDRDRDRDRNRPPRVEGEVAAVETAAAALVPTGEGAPLPGGALTPAEGRRRRRRRRGRRGAAMPPTGAPADGEQPPDGDAAGGESAGAESAGGDDDFEGAEDAFGDMDAADASEPSDPDQQ